MAISRYGARVFPGTNELVARVKARGEFIQGPQIAEFEEAFARRAGSGTAITAAYGRMAFYYILKALDLPPGSEIIFPSLTFWVVPELARVAGLTVVFADVDPRTFNIDPNSVERLITDKTRAIVPTHLYGLPCDMDRLLEIAGRHNLVRHRGLRPCARRDLPGQASRHVRHRRVVQLPDAASRSTATAAGLRSCRIAPWRRRSGPSSTALPWPSEERVSERLLTGRLQRIFIRPWVFSISLFPVLWVSALIDANPDVFLWETIRSLQPLPEPYVERFPNVQAAIGLEALKYLDDWTAQAQRHAQQIERVLSDVPDVQVPYVPPDRTHVYYQYCVYGSDATESRRSRRAVRPPRHRHRDAARRRAAGHGALQERTRRSRRRAPGVTGDSECRSTRASRKSRRHAWPPSCARSSSAAARDAAKVSSLASGLGPQSD